jgi:hypothetical protein
VARGSEECANVTRKKLRHVATDVSRRPRCSYLQLQTPKLLVLFREQKKKKKKAPIKTKKKKKKSNCSKNLSIAQTGSCKLKLSITKHENYQRKGKTTARKVRAQRE